MLFQLSVQLVEGGCAFKTFERQVSGDASSLERIRQLQGLAREAADWITAEQEKQALLRKANG